MPRRFAILCAVAAALLLAAPDARAHQGHDLAGLQIGVMSVTPEPAGDGSVDGSVDVAIGLLLMNLNGEAATLRGIETEAGQDARLLQTITLLGLSTERAPAFFRLDPGETRVVQPPDGRILVRGVRPAELPDGMFGVTLDFGPLGRRRIVVRLPAARP